MPEIVLGWEEVDQAVREYVCKTFPSFEPSDVEWDYTISEDGETLQNLIAKVDGQPLPSSVSAKEKR